MWAILMISLMLASVAGVIYLITRINKFGFMGKITERKALRLVIATAIVIISSALIWIFWGSMDAENLKVQVIAVIYNRRDQLRALMNISLEK